MLCLANYSHDQSGKSRMEYKYNHKQMISAICMILALGLLI